MREKKHFLLGFCIVLFLLIPGIVLVVPGVVTYQGRLTNVDGTPVDNANYNIQFSIYDVASGGTPLWTEGQTVSVMDGIYSVSLGSVTPIPSSILDNPALYLGIQVEADSEMSPRQEITSTFYAVKAGDADTLDGLDSTAFAEAAHTHSGNDIASGTVNEAYIDPNIARDAEITWANLSGIPTDIADGDDVGIAAESDPTVIASVKDGVSWGELSGIPAGFADGVDNNSGGDITGVTAGTGLSGGGTSGSVTLNVGMPLSLTGSVSAQGVINASNSNSSGRGVYGEATGTNGMGVQGSASDTGSGTHYGGYFAANGSAGRGVFGYASNSGAATNYGGYFVAEGSAGRGVYGQATDNGIVNNYGGYFQAEGGAGRGVYGQATDNGSGTNYGGYFTASGSDGRGVYGEATGSTGRGVWGVASNTGSVTHHYGGYFQAAGSYGWGVYSEATGLYGRGVYGYASNAEYGAQNTGGWFAASGRSGRGVVGQASGVYGTGVFGHGAEYDFYADGPGTNYGPFTGAHEVKFVQDFPQDIQPGMIVSVCGKAEVRIKDDGEISLSSTLPTVTIAQKPMDKAVFGVLVSESPLPKDHWYEAQEGERFGVINALGEGRVWVTDINGEIQAGDYITTSSIPGYGQLQDDDLLHSYTLGKAIETVDWDEVTELVEIDGKTYRAYLIAVVYTSG